MDATFQCTDYFISFLLNLFLFLYDISTLSESMIVPLKLGMIGLIIVGSIYFILLDELIMGCAQRRIGPFNLGGYGFLSSLINGCNLIISQFLVPKAHFHFGLQSFPIFFFLFSLQNYILLYPFFLVDIYLSLIILFWLMGLSIVLIIFSAFSSCSKYSMLGCIRIISQLISFELIWTTIILIFIWSWNELSIAIYWLIIPLSLLVRYSFLINCLWLVCYWLIFNHHLFAIFFFICILGESNRVPYDLPEAESELVAGFITEYSPIIFSLILLTEYLNIIAVSFWIMILFSLNYDCFIFFLFFVCLIRTTLNRLKFDELMTNAWIVILPVISSLLLIIVNLWIVTGVQIKPWILRLRLC